MIRTCISDEEAIDASEKSLDAFNAGILPVEIAIRGRSEEAVQACCVGSVARDHLVGRNDIAQVLRHLPAFFDHHALGEEALDWLVVGDHAKVTHELRPEARVDQVQNGVLDAANVLIDAVTYKPVLRNLPAEGL